MSGEEHGGIGSPYLPIIITSYMNGSINISYTQRTEVRDDDFTYPLGPVSENRKERLQTTAYPWEEISCYKQ